MAKRKDYLTSYDTYTDRDGNLKQFTVIDHDVKKPVGGRESKETKDRKKKELEELRKSIKSSSEEKIDEILLFPPIYAAYPEDDFVQAHIFNEIISTDNGIAWDEKILREVCEIDKGFSHKLFGRVWKQYVKEEFQKEELSHEQMMKKEWEKWT